MNRIVPTLILIAVLSTSCAVGITSEGFFVAAGDSTITTGETNVAGGSISESAASLLANLAKLIPFTNSVAPDITIVVPTEEEDGEI